MRRIVCCLTVLMLIGTLQAAALNTAEAEQIKSWLIPAPKKVELHDGPHVVLDKQLDFTLRCAAEAAESKGACEKAFKEWFGVKVKAKCAQLVGGEAPAAEGYRIRVAAGQLTIDVADVSGARNAMRTLRQIAEPLRGTAKLAGYFVPEMEIEDAPAMAFRGLHICWFPENKPVDIERYIRLAAYYKMNHVVLESWGMFVFKKHPEFSWPRSTMTHREVKRLVKIADELGVTLIPQINLFGHASGARVNSGKHTVLSAHPELQPLFEPLGWSWCLSNPATLELLEELALEMHDVFGRPRYFHAGCDEAYDMASCEVCRRRDFGVVAAAALKRISEALAKRECRMMMWHDMLLQQGDQRWAGYYAKGKAWTDQFLAALPRDIIICDWYYGLPKDEPKGSEFPTLRYFKEQGFTTLTCPWARAKGYEAQSKAVIDLGLDGMLSTTWHYLYSHTFHQIYDYAAHAMWGTKTGGGLKRLIIAHHLRQIGWDMPTPLYEDTGYNHYQIPHKNFTPR